MCVYFTKKGWADGACEDDGVYEEARSKQPGLVLTSSAATLIFTVVIRRFNNATSVAAILVASSTAATRMLVVSLSAAVTAPSIVWARC